MPRAPRPVIPGVPLHVTQRGNNRVTTFIAPEDYASYRDALHVASRKADCAVHAYVLMSNHVHVLLSPGDPRGPARMMQAIGRRYVRYFNDRYGRTGTLWEGRYYSALVDTSVYLLQCMRYIELNPSRAGIVAHPGDYAWSSFHHNAEGAADPLVTPHATFLALGADAAARRRAYRATFEAHLDIGTVRSIRRATRGGTTLGTAYFRGEVESLLGRRLASLTHGGDRRSEAYYAERKSRTTNHLSTTLTP